VTALLACLARLHSRVRSACRTPGRGAGAAAGDVHAHERDPGGHDNDGGSGGNGSGGDSNGSGDSCENGKSKAAASDCKDHPRLSKTLKLRFGKFAILACLALCAIGIYEQGLTRGLDNFTSGWRMSLQKLPATGNIVFIAIDKKSLDANPVWPWRRSVHANIVRMLSERGASEIFFDIDFSAPSEFQMDRAFAEAIEAADSLVVLPVFGQRIDAADAEGGFAFNQPISLLRRFAWLGTVNVAPDLDGLVRTYPYGFSIDGDYVPSYAALMAGVFNAPGSQFAVNFSIDAGTIPVYSVSDLLDGRIDPAELAGKSVIVGAHALELRDTFSVPTTGLVSGPLLQVIAAETLVQGAQLRILNPFPVLALVLGVCLVAGRRKRARRLRYTSLLLVGCAAFVEVSAIGAQLNWFLVLPSSPIHLFLAATLVAEAARELELRKLFLHFATLEARSTRGVLERVIADSGNAMLVIDEKGLVIECNERWAELFGERVETGAFGRQDSEIPAAILQGVDLAFECARRGQPVDPSSLHAEWRRAGRVMHIEYTITPSRLQRAGGRKDRGSVEITFVCVSARDVTIRREQEARLDFLSRFDPLTGAMRRDEMIARLDGRLADAFGAGETVAVWAFKLHRFNIVNATLGREVGDKLLAAVVERLSGFDSGLSLCARLTGNVFALYNTGRIAGACDLAPTSERVAEAIRRPFVLDGNTVFVGAALGFASTADAATCPALRTAEGLLDAAEDALALARHAASQAIRGFDPSSVERQERARFLERELWNAIENDELFLVYQPQVRLSDLAFAGAEALVRWRHPKLGLISPGEFIPTAEASGFIVEIGHYVLRKACQDFAGSDIPGSIAVNVSPDQFQRTDLLQDVQDVLRESGLAATRLHLEMTESMFIEGSEALGELLSDIRMLGVSLALDDFGSGYSSFGYLARFHIDKIKADQMFVRNLGSNPANAGILRSIRMLAGEIGTKLICEGIETEAQAAFLRNIGCDEGQGYYFGKPMPFADLQEFARTSGTEVARRLHAS
jgi:PAS domain S-box-containing protein